MDLEAYCNHLLSLPSLKIAWKFFCIRNCHRYRPAFYTVLISFPRTCFVLFMSSSLIVAHNFRNEGELFVFGPCVIFRSLDRCILIICFTNVLCVVWCFSTVGPAFFGFFGFAPERQDPTRHMQLRTNIGETARGSMRELIDNGKHKRYEHIRD